MLGSEDILKYFSYFSEKIGSGISCTLGTKCQILFSAKKKKITLSSMEFVKQSLNVIKL